MDVANVESIELGRVRKLVQGNFDLLTAEAVNVLCLRPDDLTESAQEQLCQASQDRVDLVAIEVYHATRVHLRQLPFWKLLLLGRGYREAFKVSEHGHLNLLVREQWMATLPLWEPAFDQARPHSSESFEHAMCVRRRPQTFEQTIPRQPQVCCGHLFRHAAIFNGNFRALVMCLA